MIIASLNTDLRAGEGEFSFSPTFSFCEPEPAQQIVQKEKAGGDEK